MFIWPVYRYHIHWLHFNYVSIGVYYGTSNKTYQIDNSSLLRKCNATASSKTIPLLKLRAILWPLRKGMVEDGTKIRFSISLFVFQTIIYTLTSVHRTCNIHDQYTIKWVFCAMCIHDMSIQYNMECRIIDNILIKLLASQRFHFLIFSLPSKVFTRQFHRFFGRTEKIWVFELDPTIWIWIDLLQFIAKQNFHEKYDYVRWIEEASGRR